MSERVPVALTIAGSDSGGGAGIEMDLKVFAALGAFGACAITALTAQNSVGVRGFWEAPPDFVADQLEAVLDDLSVGAAKTGMLSSAEVVRAVAGVLKRHVSPVSQASSLRSPFPLVVDPVIVAKDGSRLLSEAGISAVRDELIPLAALVTPNIPEVKQLTGVAVETEEEAWRAAEKLRALGCDWVLVKGGHLQGRAATDYLLGPAGAQALSSPRFPGGPFHGTGCALSSAITALLARGMAVPEAVTAGRAFVQRLLHTAQPLGKGSLLLHPTSQTRASKQL
jgi:hydroxymethylpyrimidine kinase/phosphomethylpyrimidine kinase